MRRRRRARLFVEVFDEKAKRLDGIDWLAQGTIYPDVIESAGSATGKAHVIKSQHNIGGLPAGMRMQLVERCASCSRTKCAASASSSACRRRS